MINRPGVLEIIDKLDNLIRQPIHSIDPAALKKIRRRVFRQKMSKVQGND